MSFLKCKNTITVVTIAKKTYNIINIHLIKRSIFSTWKNHIQKHIHSNIEVSEKSNNNKLILH